MLHLCFSRSVLVGPVLQGRAQKEESRKTRSPAQTSANPGRGMHDLELEALQA